MQKNSFPENNFSTPANKQEHTTSLRGTTLVPKTNKTIVLRGQIDYFQAELLCTQQHLAKGGMQEYAAGLEEILLLSQLVMRCEVFETPLPPEEISILGMGEQELRERSHHPAKYYKTGHFIPCAGDEEGLLMLNRLRTIARQTEIAACAAFETGSGETQRPDLIKALNRISSAIYIMMVMIKSNQA